MVGYYAREASSFLKRKEEVDEMQVRDRDLEEWREKNGHNVKPTTKGSLFLLNYL